MADQVGIVVDHAEDFRVALADVAGAAWIRKSGNTRDDRVLAIHIRDRILTLLVFLLVILLLVLLFETRTRRTREWRSFTIRKQVPASLPHLNVLAIHGWPVLILERCFQLRSLRISADGRTSQRSEGFG